MVTRASDVHFGQWLRERIERLGIKKQTAAGRLGVAAVTLRAWFNQPAPGMAAHNKVQVAKLLAIEVEEVERRLTAAREAYGKRAAYEDGMAASRKIRGDAVAEREEALEFDRSIEPYSELKVPEIPLFEASLAAGPWVDVSEIGEVSDPRMMGHGLFRVRLAGDSMRPAYQDGCIVEFRCLRVDRDGVVEGKDYYVQRSDGCATFKRVVKMDEESFTLAALNKRKYPRVMIVERAVVVRMARAVGIFRPVE